MTCCALGASSQQRVSTISFCKTLCLEKITPRHSGGNPLQRYCFRQPHRQFSRRRGALLACEGGMQSQEVVYHDERGTALSGYAAWMKEATEGGTTRPGVLVAHTAIGPQEGFIRDKVHQLAELGYVGFALDMFGAGHCVFGAEKEAANRVLKEDRPLIASRANAALGAMAALPVVDAERVGAIGYCLGGKVVLDLARSVPQGLRAVVSFHGILDAVGGDASWPLTAACLCYHGARDPFVSDADLLAFRDEMEAREAAYEVVMLGGCYHAFTRPEKVATEDRAAGLFYDKAAAEKSWAGACSFLKDHL